MITVENLKLERVVDAEDLYTRGGEKVGQVWQARALVNGVQAHAYVHILPDVIAKTDRTLTDIAHDLAIAEFRQLAEKGPNE